MYPKHRRRVWGGAGGLESPPQRFYKGGSASTPLLNLIAVTILANPETLDVAKKKDNIHT